MRRSQETAQGTTRSTDCACPAGGRFADCYFAVANDGGARGGTSGASDGGCTKRERRGCPLLDATLLASLQAELRAMKIATQQAQERALRLESELSTAQVRIDAAERKAIDRWRNGRRRFAKANGRLGCLRSRFACCLECVAHPSDRR